MSGTNAHVILESCSMPGGYSMPGERLPPGDGIYLLALSAKTPGSLQQRAKDLVAVLGQEALSKARLCDVAYTLLAGRHHFRYRCMILAGDIEEAVRLLKAFVGGQPESVIFTGEVTPDFKTQAGVKTYIDTLGASIGTAVGNRQKGLEILGALAEWYCQGYELPADPLFGNGAPRRIHLPGYPFARDKYWIGGPARETTSPLIEEDVLSLSEPPPEDNMPIIRGVISDILGLPEQRIEPNVRLEFYGLDSIVMMQLKNHLQEIFGEIPAGLFYEYPTLRELVSYFRQKHIASDPVGQES
jgi:polyketide synthase PksN